MNSHPNVDYRVVMRVALDQAAESAALGEVPVGALVVHEGTIVAQSHNLRETWQDPTAHAEMIVIREAAKALGRWRLIDTTLVVTLEPCAMCLGAIILARIPRLVFGATDPKAGACGSVLDFAGDPRLNHRVEVFGGILAHESQRMLSKFFRDLRARQPEGRI
ncbi:MAG TPA: tRNA adenosine(34) deaminase TadA [Nitrospira sp.]|nr:tRNA adenosine(34) deaminase TadA [Nitrospira sp.]